MQRALIFLAFGLFATAASAQVSDEVVKATAGRYRISDGAHSCVVTLTAEGSIGGWEADIAKDCARIDLTLADVGVWNFDGNGGIVLADTMRHRIVGFKENEGGPYTSRRSTGKSWTLSALDGAPMLTPAQQMTGRWRLIRDQKEVCAYDVVSAPGGKAGTIRPLPGCDPGWAGWAKWTIKGERITLRDKAGTPIMGLRRTEAITFSGMLYGNVGLDLIKDVP